MRKVGLEPMTYRFKNRQKQIRTSYHRITWTQLKLVDNQTALILYVTKLMTSHDIATVRSSVILAV